MSSPHLARVVEEAEARQLPALIDEWWDAHDVRRWLALALRIDLAVLTERPELVLPCLHRRCAWLGGWAEAGFYAERSEVPRDAAALRELVSDWRPGRPWLRALRPPQIPLDGGVLEEYRTQLQGQLRISEDAETIAVVGEEGIAAWDRLTGRRVEGARARVPAPEGTAQRWRFVHGGEWGQFALESDEGRIDLTYHDEDDTATAIRQVTDELVIVMGYHSWCLLNVRTARVQWTGGGRVETVTLAPDGERLFRAGRDTVEIVELATGRQLAWWSVPDVRELVLVSDGSVATSSPGVVRVWDPSIASRGQARLMAPDGYVPAQFSPDGQRLVTGGLLCDARTGAAIAAMEINTGGWLEGGPPAGCQRLTDEGFVEILPFGLQVWDARDGSLAVSDDDRGADGGDVVAFDPRGARHAILSEGRFSGGEPRLRVYELHSGELVFETGHVPLVERSRDLALGFSPDGEQLWWETGGERWVLSFAGPMQPRPLAEDEPTPREPEPIAIEVQDGLLAVGDAAIPCDDERVIVSPDGRTFAFRTSHYILEPG